MPARRRRRHRLGRRVPGPAPRPGLRAGARSSTRSPTALAIVAAVIGGWIAGVLPVVRRCADLVREVVVAVVRLYCRLRHARRLEVRYLGKLATCVVYFGVSVVLHLRRHRVVVLVGGRLDAGDPRPRPLLRGGGPVRRRRTPGAGRGAPVSSASDESGETVTFPEIAATPTSTNGRSAPSRCRADRDHRLRPGRPRRRGVRRSSRGGADGGRQATAIAEVESTKSVAEVYAPCAGIVAGGQQPLWPTLPRSINADPYGAGWFCRDQPGRSLGPRRPARRRRVRRPDRLTRRPGLEGASVKRGRGRAYHRTRGSRRIPTTTIAPRPATPIAGVDRIDAGGDPGGRGRRRHPRPRRVRPGRRRGTPRGLALGASGGDRGGGAQPEAARSSSTTSRCPATTPASSWPTGGLEVRGSRLDQRHLRQRSRGPTTPRSTPVTR